MVAGLFPATRATVDVGCGKPRGGWWIEQDVIDPQPGVPFEGLTPIFPEGVDPFVRMEMAQGVGPSLRDQTRICLPHLGREQRILAPALGRVDIQVGRHDVEVAGDDDGRIQCVEACQMIKRSNQRNL